MLKSTLLTSRCEDARSASGPTVKLVHIQVDDQPALSNCGNTGGHGARAGLRFARRLPGQVRTWHPHCRSNRLPRRGKMRERWLPDFTPPSDDAVKTTICDYHIGPRRASGAIPRAVPFDD